MRIFCLPESLILQGVSGGLIGLLPFLVIGGIIWAVVAIMKRRARRDAIAEGEEVVSESTALMKRYRDAYLVARATGTIGKVIKGIGILVAALGVYVVGQSASRASGMIVLLPAFVGALLYCVGVLIAAQGQILLATLDTAVNSSPFLTNEEGQSNVLVSKILAYPICSVSRGVGSSSGAAGKTMRS